MRRLLLIVLLFSVLMAGFITFRFGSALSQEGNPIPILIAIYKLEFSHGDYEQFSETDKSNRYVSENTGEFRFDVVKKFMKKKGWDFKEQMGAGLVFDKGGQTIVLGTRQYSKHYILWNIPSEVLNSDGKSTQKAKR